MHNYHISRGTAGRTAHSLAIGAAATAFVASPALAAITEPPAFLGVPADFILFALTLLGVALFHRHTLQVALAGLATIVGYKLLFTGFRTGQGIEGFAWHMHHEWVILVNLLCLLVGFALLSNHFERSRVPDILPRFLPD